MIATAVVPDLWTGIAIFVVLYLVKWRLDPVRVLDMICEYGRLMRTWIKLYHIPTVGGTSLPLLSYIGARRFVRQSKDIVQEGYRKVRHTCSPHN